MGVGGGLDSNVGGCVCVRMVCVGGSGCVVCVWLEGAFWDGCVVFVCVCVCVDGRGDGSGWDVEWGGAMWGRCFGAAGGCVG